MLRLPAHSSHLSIFLFTYLLLIVACNSSHGSHHHVVLLVHNSQKGKRKRCTVGAGCGVSACCSSAEREQPAHSPHVAEPPPPAAAPARAPHAAHTARVWARAGTREGGLRRGSWARLWRTLTTAYCSSSASGPRAASAATSCSCGRGRDASFIHLVGPRAGVLERAPQSMRRAGLRRTLVTRTMLTNARCLAGARAPA